LLFFLVMVLLFYLLVEAYLGICSVFTANIYTSKRSSVKTLQHKQPPAPTTISSVDIQART